MALRRRTLIALIMAAFAVSCAAAQNGPVREAIRDRVAGRLEAGGSEAPLPAGPGDLDLVTLTHQGAERSYYIHVPQAFAERSSALPAVLVFHGGEGSGLDAAALSNMAAAADAGGFVAIFPNSPGQQWNDGRATSASPYDDVDYVRTLITDAQYRFGIDPGRVFAAGMSNGGMFTQRLACEASDAFRAYAVAVANLPADLEYDCRPAYATPMIFFTGTADRIMPFEGGEIGASRRRGAGVGGAVLSQRQTRDFWSRVNGCATATGLQPLPDLADDGTDVLREEVGGCVGGAVLDFFVVEGGGHTWPGSDMSRSRIAGTATQDIDATREIVGFFRRYGL